MRLVVRIESNTSKRAKIVKPYIGATKPFKAMRQELESPLRRSHSNGTLNAFFLAVFFVKTHLDQRRSETKHEKYCLTLRSCIISPPLILYPKVIKIDWKLIKQSKLYLILILVISDRSLASKRIDLFYYNFSSCDELVPFRPSSLFVGDCQSLFGAIYWIWWGGLFAPFWVDSTSASLFWVCLLYTIKCPST